MSLLERLQPGPLPIFRHTWDTLAEMSLRRDDLAAREVATELLADPLASFSILHTINHKVWNRYGTAVTSVEHALMMQGLSAYLNGIRRIPILEASPAGRDPRALHALHTLTRRAQHAAWQARDFAVLHTDVRSEEVQVAALFHFFPEYLLWLRAPDVARALRRAERRAPRHDPQSRIQAQIKALGQTLHALRLQVLEAWDIPEPTIDLIDSRHADRPRQVIIRASIDIAERAETGWWDDYLLEDYVALAGVENNPMEMVIANAHMNAVRVARSADWLPVPPAGAWLCMNPGPWPPNELDDDEEAAPAAAHPAPTATSHAAEEASGVCPMPDKQKFQDSLLNIDAHLDGSLTMNQMSAIILKGLHSGLGLTRLLFATVSPDGKRLKAHVTLGIPQDDPLRHFQLTLGGNDLFGQLMNKMQGVWVNEGNREKLRAMMTPDLQQMIAAPDFYAMSLHVNDRPAGLIYADRGHHGCSLDPTTYTDFKLLCMKAARGLGKVRFG
ncbi:MAG: HDOD domain-containing protein [Betaproteobacteria bacterium]|nr:HDOD domain-containing protein [Betaproteobacteria bacterium]